MIDDLPSYDYYIPSECYITAFEQSVAESVTTITARSIDIFLPNGLVACIQQNEYKTLADLRQILRKRYNITWPFHFLSITHTYTNDSGDILLDEQQSLDTLGLVYPFLRVSARGESAPLCNWLSPVDRSDMDSLVHFVEQLVEWRDSTIPQEILHAPPSIADIILSNIDSFLIHLDRRDKSYVCSPSTTCNELIDLILSDDKQSSSSFDYSNASTRPMLKFSFRNEFLNISESYPLLQYTYIQECLQKNVQINVQLIHIEIPHGSKKRRQIKIIEPDIFPASTLTSSNHDNEPKPQLIPLQPSSLMFKFTFRLPPSPSAKQTLFQFHSGIYYARRCLYSFESITWNNTLCETMTQNSPLPINCLLPGTLLCFALTTTNKQLPAYFLNVNLFHSNGILLHGLIELNFNLVNTTHHVPNTKHLYPDAFIGCTANGGGGESIGDNYQIKLKFDTNRFRFYINEEITEQLIKIHIPTPTAVTTAKQQQHHELSNDIANGEALNYLLGILNEETQYSVREPSWLSDCASAPIDALPCILHSLHAEIHRMILAGGVSSATIYEKLFSMYKFVDLWPPMSFEMCFFLLDCTLPDAHVRSYAVSQLVRLPNHRFLFYLPQILQAALQFESYVDTPLVRLVLKRALCHRAIGQRLFWILFGITTRNGRAMFELYKTYCGLTIANDLQAQVTLTLKLQTINQRIRTTTAKDALSMKQALLSRLGESDETSWRCVSPLDTGCLLGSLLINECHVYDSFMRPFKLVWQNALNPKHERFEMIYKIGDDLRQDVLTLQIFRLFDSIWKQNSCRNLNGEDYSQLQNLHMTFYDVMCTNDTSGFIRIVPHAYTILNIYHRLNITTTMKRNVVYDWLVLENNNNGQKAPISKAARRPAPDATDLTVPNNVLAKFRKSCAAYCTAGFVLGLGDRHPSNIMLTPDGRLFHVDFGHILGDYLKFGNIFPRETTSIVLVEPFLYVINNRQSIDNVNYRDFIQICLQTFRLLREHATSLFGLLYLIIYARLPLLNTVSHLNYLRQSLFLLGDKPCETKHAIQAYRRRIESAQNDTRRFLDWIAHAFVHKPQR